METTKVTDDANAKAALGQSGFGHEAGALLLGLAAARLLSNLATTGMATPHDPLLSLTLRQVFWLAGGLEFAVGLACLLSCQPRLKTNLVLWLALNQLIYLTGLWWTCGRQAPVVHAASLGETFGLAPALAFGLLLVSFLYLLASSGRTAARLWVRRDRAAEAG